MWDGLFDGSFHDGGRSLLSGEVLLAQVALDLADLLVDFVYLEPD